MKDEQSAIGADEADVLLAPLRRYLLIVLAVSGGPDSLALMTLVAEFHLRHGANGQRVLVATVDHRLRPEAADEAQAVSRHAARFGFDHTTLCWEDCKPAAGIADAARQARYALLDQYVRTESPAQPAALVTGHTEDDQAETVLMRLKRGAGVDGLASMAPCRPLTPGSHIDLVRPLLGLPKTRLEATLVVRNTVWVEDPSNEDEAYERVRVRRELVALKNIGLTPHALALTARRVLQARETVDYAMSAFMPSLALTFNGEIFAEFDRAAFDAGPVLLRQRLLSKLIARFGGATPAPHLAELERLVERMQGAQRGAVTLGGATISIGRRYIRLWREAGRIATTPLYLAPGESKIWDQRFRVGHSLPDLPLPDLPPADVTPPDIKSIAIHALGEEGFGRVVASGVKLPECPAHAAYALPAFWSQDRLMAVPQLGFFDPGNPDVSAGCATLFTSEPLQSA